ncbi:MAG: response regulator, partial [Proteobacteria bacterium]|nr:response regulator [Pseudomonadota bacterium]
ILVVEDDSAVLKLAVELLERLGYRTSQAENAQQAMEILESDQEIMLLLTDVILSGGKNGAELAAAALGKWPELQVLYMSGYTENAIVHQGRLDDGIQLLAKPFTKLQLSRKVRKAFAQRPAQTSDD